MSSTASREAPTRSASVAGAGIWNNANVAVDVIECYLRGNEIERSGSVVGGGIATSGPLRIIRSTLRANKIRSLSGGSAHGGGVWVNHDGAEFFGSLEVINSTISQNEANSIGDPGGDAAGGAIYVGSTTNGLVSIRHSTLIGNSATARGGAVASDGSVPTYSHALLGANFAPVAPDVAGAAIGDDYNIIARLDGSTGFNTDGTDESLATLGVLIFEVVGLAPIDHGGPTPTHQLAYPGPAVDTGDPAITGEPRWDQRGRGFPRIVLDRIDIGSYELEE